MHLRKGHRRILLSFRHFPRKQAVRHKQISHCPRMVPSKAEMAVPGQCRPGRCLSWDTGGLVRQTGEEFGPLSSGTMQEAPD